MCDKQLKHKIVYPLANCAIKNCTSGKGCFDGLIKTNETSWQHPHGEVLYYYHKSCMDSKKCNDDKEQVCKGTKYKKKDCLKYRCCDEDLCNIATGFNSDIFAGFAVKPDIFAGFAVFVFVSVLIQAVFQM